MARRIHTHVTRLVVWSWLIEVFPFGLICACPSLLPLVQLTNKWSMRRERVLGVHASVEYAGSL